MEGDGLATESLIFGVGEVDGGADKGISSEAEITEGDVGIEAGSEGEPAHVSAPSRFSPIPGDGGKIEGGIGWNGDGETD